MIKYFLLFLFISSCTKVQSQAIQFYTSDKIEDYDAASFRLIDQDSLNLFAFRYKQSDYFLDVYDKETLNRSAVIKIPLPPKNTIYLGRQSMTLLCQWQFLSIMKAISYYKCDGLRISVVSIKTTSVIRAAFMNFAVPLYN